VFFPCAKGIWQARSIYPNVKPKYISKGKLSECVYNITDVSEWCTICEGPINALSVPHGVAVFGKNISETQFMLLTSKFKRAIIAFDFGAEREADAAKELLSKYMEVSILRFESEKDCNEIGYTEMERRIDEHNKDR